MRRGVSEIILIASAILQGALSTGFHRPIFAKEPMPQPLDAVEVFEVVDESPDKEKELGVDDEALAAKCTSIVLRDEEFYHADILELSFARWKTAWCTESGQLNERALSTYVKEPLREPTRSIEGHLKRSKESPNETERALVACRDLAMLVDAACECKSPKLAIEWIKAIPLIARQEIDYRSLLGNLTDVCGVEETVAMIESQERDLATRLSAIRPHLLAAVVEQLCGVRDMVGRPVSLDRVNDAERVAELLVVGKFPEKIPRMEDLRNGKARTYDELAARSKWRMVQSIGFAELLKDEKDAIEFVSMNLPGPYARFCFQAMALNLVRQGALRIQASPPPFEVLYVDPQRTELDSGRFGR